MRYRDGSTPRVAERDKAKPDQVPVLQRGAPPAFDSRESYMGYIPKREEKISHEAIDALDAEILWSKYISTRRPVVIDGLVHDENWDGGRWQDLEYLRSIAGDTEVKIEPLDTMRDRFGTGAMRKKVPLAAFLDILTDESERGKWYMTTQYEEDEEKLMEPTPSLFVSSSQQRLSPFETEKSDESTLPEVDLDLSLPPPTDALAHLFPLPGPKIMGGLVLQQCNLWMGSGASGKSSGLHHDFHDNLYMLLSGRKRFLIWPPLAHRWLEPTGDIERVHRNGLIEYHVSGQPPLRPDGLTSREAAEWLVRARKRAVVEADERAAQKAGESSRQRSQRKGKARQTQEQEDAMERLRAAEHHLFLLDTEYDMPFSASSDEADSDLQSLARVSDEDSLTGTETDISGSNESETDSEDAESLGAPPRKRARNTEGLLAADKLHIRKRGLPGGFRGTPHDNHGDLTDVISEEELEDELVPTFLEHEWDSASASAEETTQLHMQTNYVSSVPFGSISHTDSPSSPETEDEHWDLEQHRDGSPLSGNPTSLSEERKRLALLEALQDDESEEQLDGSLSEWSSHEDGEATLAQLAQLQRAHDQDTDDDVSSGTESSEEEPSSFSQITPQAMHWYFGIVDDPSAPNAPPKHPSVDGEPFLIPKVGCPRPLEVFLRPGQMLYLPASWYHEVTSYCEAEDSSKGKGNANFHMALNYWFHPPTAVPKGRWVEKQAELRTSMGSKAANAQDDDHGAANPYVDKEIWNEIRTTVQSRILHLRAQAKAKMQGKKVPDA